MPYSPTTWVNGSSPPISAANLNHLELAVKAAYPIYNVQDSAYGAVGNGSTDDTTALQAAITAAQATGGLVYSPPGYTYMVSAQLNITATCQLDFTGSTIKKLATFPVANIFQVTAANVVIRRVVLDGNRAGGATGGGIYWQAAGGYLERVTSSHHVYTSIQFDSSTTLATVVNCTASDNTGTGATDGFKAHTGSIVEFYQCRADSNERAGFYLDSTAGVGCVLDGKAYQNGYSAAVINSNYGFIREFRGQQNNQFGITMTNATGWKCDFLEMKETGFAIPGFGVNGAGTGVEVYGSSHNAFGTIVSNDNLGYGLVLTTFGGQNCTYNSFHTMTLEAPNAAFGDPGLSIQSGSTHNTFAVIRVSQYTVGVNIGEGTTGNDANAFGVIHATLCDQGAVQIDGGNGNSFQNIVSRNCYNNDLTLASKAIVAFSGTAQDNVVGFLDHDDTGTDHTTVPTFLAYADATAVNNSILDGFARASRSTSVDANGGNFLYLRRPQRRQQITSWDATETWSNSTTNTTNGQFVEGTGSKKVTGSPSFTASTRTGLSINLSAMANGDWFRMFAYITNVSDFSGAGPLVLRFVTTPGNYFQTQWDTLGLVNGAQWLGARKGAFTSTGTPNWASITEIDVLVYGTTSISTVSFDDLCWLHHKWDRTSTIGQNNTPAAITVGASPFLYQNIDSVPLNVMVSGGTVSAIDYSQDGSTFYSQGQTAGIFVVNPGDYTRVTYSVAPTMSKVPTR